jgi:fructosamine-3-kinase
VADFVKTNAGAPAGFFELEAAGLRWLSVQGGVPCAHVVAYDERSLTLERLVSVAPTREAARDFGSRLAVTHDAGAPLFGCAPDGWYGDGYFGPLTDPLPMSLLGHRDWGAFYAEERLRPMANLAEWRLSADAMRSVQAVIERCLAGDFDDDDSPARIHGDLWSGNVLAGADGRPWLVDPAAYGGHREMDLAMLALFASPSPRTLAAYAEVAPLASGHEDRVGLWQLFPLLVHAVLFGGVYGASAERIATRYAG